MTREQRIVQVVERHQVWLWRYLRTLGCSAPDADDLVQDTFVAFFQNEMEDRHAGATARYLRSTARNLFVSDRRRRRAVRDVAEADLVWDRFCGNDDGAGYFDAIARCLDELAPRARRAVVARHVEGVSRAECAEELGIRTEGVKTLLRRAVATMRECVARRTDA